MVRQAWVQFDSIDITRTPVEQTGCRKRGASGSA
jgi:hypothetical protein